MIATLQVSGQVQPSVPADGSAVVFMEDDLIALQVDGASFRIERDDGARCCVTAHLRDAGARMLRDELDRLLGTPA